ncbi:MAG: S8 family peptidase [Paramuribaculum sp.]|nr:S8 family peptidase [Paramuribaculum sp.]
MKHIYAYIALALFTLDASAQSKISHTGLMELDRHRTAQSARTEYNTKTLDAGTTKQVTAIVRLNEGYCAEDLLSVQSIAIEDNLGDLVMINAPINDMERLAELDAVKSISFGGKRRAHMYAARPAANVDEAHSGIEVGGDMQTFTGKGVILGMMDGGLEPNHINFMDADGNSRVKKLWKYTGSSASVTTYNQSTISSFTTDDAEETHATHVAGIMGGSYKGTATYTTAASKSKLTGNIPYYGVAPDAELALACGDFYDSCILKAVKTISDYAKAEGKPVAINLSLGSNDGPHDGTDNFTATLNEYGKDAIICISSGNEGSDNMSITKTFSTGDTSVKTILYYNSSYSSGVDGVLDIWASDSRPLTVTISTCNSSGTLTQRTKSSSATSSSGVSVSGVKSGGSARLYAGVDANNNRYNVSIDFSEAYPSTGRFAITVEGAAGQKVNMYFSGYTEFTNKYSPTGSALSGFTAGTPDESINGMACGPNTLAIGAYTSSQKFRDLNLGLYGYGETQDDICSFSSYGHGADDMTLPHVLAPGSAIASSFSSYYVAQGYQDESADDMMASATVNSKTHYWGPMQGTSMACPFATGTMALWLEADPSLTVHDMVSIINATSINDSYTTGTANAKRAGAGKLDAAAGLRHIVGLSAIGTVKDNADMSIIITPASDGYYVATAGDNTARITLTDMQGRTVKSICADGSETFVSTNGLTSGIYLLTVDTHNTHKTRKIAVR